MRTTKPGIGGPFDEGDFKKGRRLAFMLDLVARITNLGWVPMFELKGDTLGGWVEDLYTQIKPFGGILVWHWSPKSTKKLGDPAEPVSEQLKAMAVEANRLWESVGLAAATIHCAPAQAVQPGLDAGLERYNSPIGAVEMFEHIKRQIDPIRALNQATGGILHIENVDITNFRDGGYKLPTYLELQTCSGLDLHWLRGQTGVSATFDSEHLLCTSNLLFRRRDMATLPKFCDKETVEEAAFSQISGYWLRRGYPPEEMISTDIARFIRLVEPRLYHFGGAVQAEINGTIGTHLPLDPENAEQMAILDYQLARILEDDTAIGAVHEVVGQLYADDPANPGHNRYSKWSPRIADDEEAKEQTLLVILDRIETIQSKT